MFGKPQPFRWLAILGIIGLLSVGVDRLWIALDRSVPSWDPADNLTNALNFWGLFQQADSEGWTAFWMRSSKYPPLLFALTGWLQTWVGTHADQALLVNLLFSAVLLASVYGIGRHLFSQQVGLWAAGLCVLLPRLYTNRIQYFMDYPLTALVTASFFALTLWRDEKRRARQWLWAIGFGLSFGLAILTKQSALFFLVVPLVWLGVQTLQQRTWERLAQLLSGALVTLAIALPWVRTNWVFQLSAAFNSNIKSALAEGDPPLTTPAAWLYYWNDLPAAVSLPLLIVPLAGLALYGLGRLRHPLAHPAQARSALAWLAVFWVGSYLIWSGIFNKDARYVMPYLPVVAVFLAFGLTRWSARWRSVPWITVGLAALLMALNLFPIGGAVSTTLTRALSPHAALPAYRGADFPHPEVIDAIIRTQPYQTANLGMLASTPEVNQHTFNYYGNLRSFQVHSRQMGRESEDVEDDLRSLSWFLVHQPRRRACTDREDPRCKAIQAIEQSPDFRRHQAWTLPDKSQMRLYHRPVMPVEVQPLTDTDQTQVRLDRVTLPDRAPPDEPLPITYEWSGDWEALRSGLVLLTWRHQARSDSYWIHDHAIGLGTLFAGQSIPAARVTERTAMFVSDAAVPGSYRLEAAYLNPATGETYAIAVPPITLTVDPNAPELPAPDVDWVTRLRLLAHRLPKGLPELERILAKLGQINMYDPTQSYVTHAEQSLRYRLQQDPQNLDYAYGLALTQVLQQRVEGAIAALETVVKLDSQNPNAYAYLATVHLYALHPRAATAAIQSARALSPAAPELEALSAAAALLRGNLWQAWREGQSAIAQLEAL